jgi:hypothetical protein
MMVQSGEYYVKDQLALVQEHEENSNYVTIKLKECHKENVAINKKIKSYPMSPATRIRPSRERMARWVETRMTPPRLEDVVIEQTSEGCIEDVFLDRQYVFASLKVLVFSSNDWYWVLAWHQLGTLEVL